MGWRRASCRLGDALALALVVELAGRCHGGVTSSFVRKKEKTVDMPLDSDVFRVPPGYNAPQQVHITQGDHDGESIIASWVTQDEPGSSRVLYGTDKDKLEFYAEGKYTRHNFYNYTSGCIHHCTIRNLKGILDRVLTQIAHFLIMNQIPRHRQCYLLETFLMQITTQIITMSGGTHGAGLLREVLHISLGFGLQEIMSLTLLLKLVKMCHLNHTVTGIMFRIGLLVAHLHSGTPSNGPQHTSLSWHLIQLMYRISNIAYNIVNGKCTPVPDQSSPVYITIGDGGNVEGLATNMTDPQPSYSAYRETSFGHAIFHIKNRTHAYYTWHRNQDGNAVAADSMWFYNRYWHPIDDSTISAT